jgi:hypothetical protein
MIEHEEMAQEEGGDETERDQEDSEEEEEEGMWIDDNEAQRLINLVKGSVVADPIISSEERP